MLTFRTARIENKASKIKAAFSAGTATALAQQYFQELVEQRKELSKEKERLRDERRELQHRELQRRELQRFHLGGVQVRSLELDLERILFIAYLSSRPTCRSNCQRSQ